MSIETWLEQYGETSNLNEYGETQEPKEAEVEVEAEPNTDAEDDQDYEPIEDYDSEPEAEEVEVEEEKPQKKVQSKEENARYAEQRRQLQLEMQIQERLKQSKEYQTTQLLAEMYGISQDEVYNRLNEARLQRQAQEQNVPVQYLREREQLRQHQEQLQEQLHTLMYQQWQSRIDGEKSSLKQQYNMLSDEDLDSAAYYMLNDLKRTDLPLENAVFALHGSKILGGLKNTAKNEALAEVSGRKKSPLPVKSGKASSPIILSDEERYIANKLGLTDKEYSKWKEGN